MEKVFLTSKHGIKIIQDFNQALLDPNITLISLAKKYGFTRQRAYQIADKLFGKGELRETRLQVRQQKRIRDRKKKTHPYARPDSKGVKTERLVWDKLISLGFKPYSPLYRNLYDLKVNNKRLDIRGCYGPTVTPGPNSYTTYYHIQPSKKIKKINFTIIYISKSNDFYIIPSEKLKGRMIYIRATPEKEMKKASNHHNWQEYKEAWGLLK